MSLENTNAALGEWVEKQSQAKAAQNKVENQPSIEGQTEVPKPTEEPAKPEAEAAPKEPEKVAQVEPEKVEPPVTLSWDADETPVQKAESGKFDFNKLGSALELGEVKDEGEFVTKISQLKDKIKQLEEAPLSGTPEELKEILKVTKAGGDWKQYLAENIVDYSKADPLKLYEDQFFEQAVKLQKFRNPDGSINQVAIFDALDAIPEVSRLIEGGRIQQGMIATQQTRKNQFLYQAQERLGKADKDLSNSTKVLNELLPFESYGIKFEPKHSSQIYEGISNSKLTKKHLGISYEDLVRSGADMKQIARTIATAEYVEPMLKFKSKNSEVQAKRDLLNKVQNVQLTTPGTTVKPDDEKKKTHTAVEILTEHFKTINKSGLK